MVIKLWFSIIFMPRNNLHPEQSTSILVRDFIVILVLYYSPEAPRAHTQIAQLYRVVTFACVITSIANRYVSKSEYQERKVI